MSSSVWRVAHQGSCGSLGSAGLKGARESWGLRSSQCRAKETSPRRIKGANTVSHFKTERGTSLETL